MESIINLKDKLFNYSVFNTYILLSSKPWHSNLFVELSKRKGEKWTKITEKDYFTAKNIKKINPDIIFIPHWSYIIPSEIYENFECVVFHMTDLPYGRGGSPLQNLIVRGHEDTMISALRVDKGIDTGDVYLKKPLSLEGTAEAIFERSVPIVFSMIEEIIDNELRPAPQKGEAVEFKRRKPQDGQMNHLSELSDVYDYIRMLDAPGYPKAFVETDHLRIEFEKGSIEGGKEVTAYVRVTKK